MQYRDIERFFHIGTARLIGGVEPDFTCNDDILRDVEMFSYVFFNLINYVVTYLMALQETKQYFT